MTRSDITKLNEAFNKITLLREDHLPIGNTYVRFRWDDGAAGSGIIRGMDKNGKYIIELDYEMGFGEFKAGQLVTAADSEITQHSQIEYTPMSKDLVKRLKMVGSAVVTDPRDDKLLDSE